MAPLYYLQLRRALGLGPKRHPPCITHLHTPTEFVVWYNDWDIGLPHFLTAKRLEDYSIAAADALLCPSRYLAREMEARHGFANGTVEVIPYPIGDTPLVERDNEVWEHGTICYVGRLEQRKGVIEWVDAAVAHEYPTAHFEFVGADTLDSHGRSVREFLERRIPKDLKCNFHFRGRHERGSVLQFLARARVAVVPSRWENFPNVCIEAMSSGLPVIASREGGMVEMIRDGQTGWLARKAGSEGLAEALRRALETPPIKIADMGRNASSDIRQMCKNEKIVARHLDFRSRIVKRGSKRSLHLPLNLPWAGSRLSQESARRNPQNDHKEGLAIVVTCCNTAQLLGECLRSLERQTQKPAGVVVVVDELADGRTVIFVDQARRNGWQVIHERNGGSASAKNAGIEAILSSGLKPLGFAFLSPDARLDPRFVYVCESVLQRCPEVGLVSCWIRDAGAGDRIWIKPCPSFPYQWLSNEAAPFSVVRTEALREAGKFRPVMSQGYEEWDLVNAVMAAGWVAVTLPEVLGEHRFDKDPMPYTTDIHTYGRMRRELLERFPDLINRDAKDIVLLAESMAAQILCQERFTLRGGLARLRRMLRHPRRTALAALERAKNKILRRASIWRSYPILSQDQPTSK
ncbi:MAG: glycosyltransferase [Deltaproteobacteria bacterium]|nr:glycosyltransferase [Deltaproteobacteria bacterium]